MQAKRANSITECGKTIYSVTAAEKSKEKLMDSCLSVNPFHESLRSPGHC